MKRIRVLHFNSERTWRGGETQIGFLIDDIILNYDNIECVVVCRKDSPLYFYCMENKISVYPLKIRHEFDIIAAYQFFRICAKSNIDLIHIHAARANAIAFLSYLFFGNSTKVVLSRRVDYKIKRNPFSIAKYNYPSIKKILCVSKVVQDIITPRLKKPSLCTVVHDGVLINRILLKPNFDLYKQFNLPSDAFIIGNTSALTEQKDYPTFLKAATLIIKKIPTARFFIVGDGHLRSILINMVRELHLGEYVFFLGFRKDVLSILQQFHIFLFTSQFEGLGSSLLDSYTSKVPVVSTNVGGISEVVEHGKTGFLASAHDYEALAKYSIDLIESPNLRQQFIEAALEKVDNFSKEKMVKSTVSVYIDIMKET